MTSILEFVAPIVLLIIIHELGHFIACKLFNVEVEEFGLGFPPRAVRLFEAGGTIYSLNWLPLGGFVRPKGENDPTIEGGLAAATPWKRIAVFAAGPIMNIGAAILLYGLLFAQLGKPDVSRVLIYGVDENSPAESAGLLAGDIIKQINDVEIVNSAILVEQVALNLDKETDLTLLRDDTIVVTSLVPRSNPPAGRGAMGIQYGNPMVSVTSAEAIVAGGQAALEQAKLIFTIPSMLVRGALQPSDARLLGYKGMYDMYQSVKETEVPSGTSSAVNSLGFFAMISLSLGLINLMPIPAVDGGRILFALPEILFRKRIPTDYENIINFVSFSLLIILMIYINVQDFVNPVQF